MRAYLLHQDDIDLETDFRLYPKFVPFYVEDHSVVTQNAGTRVSSFNVRRPTPTCVLYLTNPRVERGSDFGVLQCEFGEELFSN